MSAGHPQPGLRETQSGMAGFRLPLNLGYGIGNSELPRGLQR